MKRLLILISFLLLISGCYDYRELNDMSIVSGIGIDKIDGKYKVSLEIIKSIKDGASNKQETTIVSGESKVLADAFLKAQNNSDKYVYMEHVEVLLISTRLAKDGIKEIVDYIIRDSSINSNYYMVLVDDVDDTFSYKQENDSVSNKIVNTIDYDLGRDSFDDLDILASDMINDRKDIALPKININNSGVIFKSIGYFSKDKMVGEIDNKMYSFLILENDNTNFSKDDNTISIYNNKVSYKVNDNKVKIIISGEGLVKSINDNIDLEDTKEYGNLSKIIEGEIKKDIKEFLILTLEDNSDLLGLKDKYYKKYKRNINNVRYEIDVNITINKNGIIYGVLYD